MVFDHLVEHVPPRERYSDPHLCPPEHPAQLDGKTVAGIGRRIAAMVHFDEPTFARWLGAWLTEPKEHLLPELPMHEIDGGELARRLRSGAAVSCTPGVRFLFIDDPALPMTLFAGGDALPAPIDCADLIRELTLHQRLDGEAFTDEFAGGNGPALLAELVNRGYLILHGN